MVDIVIKVASGSSVRTEHAADAADEGIWIDGEKVLDTQQAFVADASVAHALNSTFSDTEAEAALNALGTKINAIFDILIAHGLMASS